MTPFPTNSTEQDRAEWLAHANRMQPIREAYFALVQDKANWKNPINAFVPSTIDLDAVRDAVVHFTGSVPTFTMTRGGWIVQADGYYKTIGA